MTLWIGVRKTPTGTWQTSNGGTLTPLQSDWAPGEPKASGGSCVVADMRFG